MHASIDWTELTVALQADMRDLAREWRARADQLRRVSTIVEGVLPDDWPPSVRADVLELCASELTSLLRGSVDRVAQAYKDG